MAHGISVIFFSFLWISGLQATVSRIYNTVPRRDTAGSIVNAHDGCIVQYEGVFYMYGTVYENCTQPGPICNGECGYYPNTFALYTSPDLKTWTLRSNNIVPEMSKDNTHVSYWMPNVAYNTKTKTWVMQYWDGKYGFQDSRVAIATSSTPLGPFTIQPPITMKGGKIISSTTGLFVDPATNIAYVRYNTRDSPLRHVVEELTPDWMGSTGKYSTFFTKNTYPWYEGGGMFKNRINGMFYIMIGSDCCFCQWGSDALVFYANHPLGPWTQQALDVIDCANNKIPQWAAVTNGTINPCDPQNPDGTFFEIPAQQFNVIEIEGGDDRWTYLYYGERSKSAPDHLKSHNFQAWIPVEFDGIKMRSLTWVEQFMVDIK